MMRLRNRISYHERVQLPARLSGGVNDIIPKLVVQSWEYMSRLNRGRGAARGNWAWTVLRKRRFLLQSVAAASGCCAGLRGLLRNTKPVGDNRRYPFSAAINRSVR
jgi:hypothetical protein